MSYLVLARKWRPQAFEDVTGQEHVVQTLANAIAHDRVAHAFLLCGPRGVGKTTTARLLARALNCASGPTATPCGTCQPCLEIVAGSSVDVVEIDGASNNGVDNVRELREAARYMPQRDRHKVFIIDEVHMLSVAAFNALLKTLEEPPPHVKFVFATTDPQKLPDTILSRCQRHNFRRVPAGKMIGRLRTICEQEGIAISDRALGLVARQADGGMRDALSLLDQLLSSAGSQVEDAAVEEALGLVDRTVVHEMAGALLDRDGKHVIELVAGVYDRGFDPKRLCEELAQHLRDLLYVKAIGQAPGDRGDVEAKALLEQARKADAAQITRLFDLVHGAIRDLTYAAQPRLALEVALLSAVHLAPAQGLADLAARLEAVAGGSITKAPAAPAPAPMPPQPQRPSSAPTPMPRAAAAATAAFLQNGGGDMGRRPPPSAPAVPSPDDLIRQVEAMANGRAAPRQGGGRPARGPMGGDDGSQQARPPQQAPQARGGGFAPPQQRPPFAPPPQQQDQRPVRDLRAAIVERAAQPWADDEPPPPGDDDLPPSFDEAPVRPLVVDTSPGGCATNECRDPADDPTMANHERWRQAVAEIRRKSALLGNFLAEGRLLWLRTGEVALGFTPAQSFHKAQLEGNEFRRQAEDLLGQWFGTPTRLALQEAAADAPASVADEQRKARDERARRLRTEAREHPAVLAVQSILGGEIDAIEVLEER